MGVAMELITRHAVLSPEVRLLITTGFLGGLTTFSTFSAEVTTLLVRREWLWSALTIGFHVVGSVALTVLGILLARMLFTWGSP
jgi:CrcB protein